jgi:transposase
MQVVEHHAIAELRSLARMESDPKMVLRLYAIALAKSGKTAPEVAAEVGYSRRGVQSWIHWYNHGGVEELRNQGGQGRKPTLSEQEREKLKQRLNGGPLPERDKGVCTLRGSDVQRILQEEFGKVRCLSAVYNLLHEIGYNDLVPRPQHKDADPAAQEAFKKSAGTDRANRRGTSRQTH